MEKRLLEAGLIKPKVRPPSVAQIRRRVVERLSLRFDRNKLYEEIWQKPATEVAESYGGSGVYLGSVCRSLGVPDPPRGYWAKVRSGGLLPPLLPRNDAAHVLVEEGHGEGRVPVAGAPDHALGDQLGPRRTQ